MEYTANDLFVILNLSVSNLGATHNKILTKGNLSGTDVITISGTLSES